MYMLVVVLIFILCVTVEDLDGIPLEDELLPPPRKKPAGAFVPSKWETVDPEQVEAQAMTTSKWDLLEPPQPVSTLHCLPTNDNGDALTQLRKRSREIALWMV